MNNLVSRYKILFVTIILFSVCSASNVLTKELDRTKRPMGQVAPKIKLPKIQKAKLTNGLNIWLVEHHELPTVALNLVIQSGSDHDLSQSGLAAMTADMLDEGTRTRDALQIADELESIGASMGVSSSVDGSFASLSTLTKHFDKALNIYADVLMNPSFPDKEFQRLRKQRLTSLMQQRDQPPAIANNSFNFILYGSQHPYGNNVTGNETSLNEMTVDDCENFYRTYYRPNNATLVIVGDVSLKEVSSKLETSFANWKKQDATAITIPEVQPISKRVVYLIDKPGAAQSEIRIGYPALARSTPDYFPVMVMNRMLGGQFASRINMNLREKHGYTYGARSGFSFLKGTGPFSASAGVTTAKTDSSLIEFMYELNKMYAEGMTVDELSFVKKGLIGGFALGFETPSQIAGGLQSIILYGLPENYFENYLTNIEKISLSDVEKVSKKYLDTEKMAVVVVGDLTVIKDGILSLRLGEIEYRDVDGKPIR
ncbi:MAG: insulinase family protein [Ignavibacteriales bacterium]|nr:insulinase family protein [Ignavibacteriales bacterium]